MKKPLVTKNNKILLEWVARDKQRLCATFLFSLNSVFQKKTFFKQSGYTNVINFFGKCINKELVGISCKILKSIMQNIK